MFKLNQKGMTLVETMVAAGLLGGLAVAGMTLFKTQTKAQKTVEQNYETTATLGAIRSILADLTNCQLTLGNKTPVLAWNSVAPPAITRITKRVNGVDSFVYTRNTDLPGTSLRITSYALSQSYPGLETPTATGGETMLEINFSRGNNVQVDAIRKTVRINYSAAAGVITSCYAVTSGASDSLWQIEGTGPDIFYPVGNVGIGTSTPTVPLQVERTESAGARHEVARFSLTDSTGPATRSLSVNLPMGTTQGFGLSWNTNSRFDLTPTSGTPAISINGTNGFVGIGTTNINAPFVVDGGLDDNPATFRSGDNISRISLGDPTGSAFMQVNGVNRFLQLSHTSISNDGIFIRDDGNVGIGDNLPTQKLIARGNIQSRGTAVSHTATLGEAGASASLGFATGYLGFNAVRDAAASTWRFSGDGANNGGTALYGSMNGILRFVTTPSTGGGNQTLSDAQVAANTRMVINAAGDVGIGTTSPQAALDVRAAGSNAQIKFGRASNSVGEGYIGANNNHALLIHGQDLATQQNLVTVTQTGNLGIGGSSATRLGIYDTSPVQLVMRHNGASNNDPVTFTVDESTPNAVQFWISPGDDFDAGGTTDKFHIGDYATGVARFTVLANGWTGINQPNPTQMLDVNGGFVRAQGYMYSSDKRLKKDIEELKNPLKRILALKGHSFSWKDSNEKDMGFIAQEVQEVEPTLVAGQDADFLSVKYGNITALLVEAFKELKLMIDGLFQNDKKLEAELAQVKAKNAELEARLDKQDKLIQQILSEKKK